MSLFLPTYFSPISQYIAIVNSDEVLFETEDNYQKQTYRNRCYIYGPNGKQLLNIPVKHTSTSSKKKTKDTLVDNTVSWQSQHLKSIQIAYRNSPFFEFYEDDLLPILSKKYKYLLDVNTDTYLFITDALQINQEYKKTAEYQLDAKNDYRLLANAKQEHNCNFKTYIQTFDDKFGFLKNLSILDLLFMEGPNTISFLENNTLTLGESK
ncbi:hypothetical protein KCTC32516_01591 [Polaribacter huanghezhanensis]|uniref:WbqC family protein n=1 Tax=Polaribacter huanghezhanensis TaxID=1354726 RepID=UPI00264782B4|nr:WbqC family protein [Polaribacter huanghezhanensis]WKD86230.1 hypothetical protein KCTC32516_01591 [Polaribacter huanghezhanensis]